MEVYHEQIGTVTAIRPSGRLDSATSSELDSNLHALIKDHSAALVLDLSEIEYISSAGLRVILALAKRSTAAQGSFALHGLSPAIRDVFDVSGFSTILSIHDSGDAAIAAVSQD